MKQHVELDPNLYVVVPHTAILDEFRMTGADGAFVADITPVFIARLIAHMAEREALTGDLCPLVIGHTQDGIPELDQPPLVGYARNWHKGVLGDTGRVCAFFDAWVLKDCVDLVRKFPRRSGEVWASRYEIDPISLLGATTPARDLGLMKLSREGSITYYPPGDMTMPEDKKPDPKADDKKPEPKKEEPKAGPAADPKESGEAKGKDGKLDQILAGITQLIELLSGGAAGGGAGAAVPAGDAKGSDADYEKFLQELMAGQDGAQGAEPPADASRAGDKPTPNAGGYAAPEPAKLSRSEQEVADLRAELTRMQVKDSLVKLNRVDVANPDDSQFVEDLVAMHPDLRKRTLERLQKTPAAPGQGSTHLSRAIDGAVADSGTGRKRMTKDDATRLSRKTTERQQAGQKVTFEQVAAEEGFDLSAR